MPLFPLEQLLTHVDSKYRLVIVAAKRAKQLMRGADHLIAPKSLKPAYIALEEIGAGKLAYEMKAVEGAGGVELVSPETAGATWFRSLAVGDTLGEEEVVEREEEEKEGAEPEETSAELLVESGEEIEKLEVTDLDALEEPEEEVEAEA